MKKEGIFFFGVRRMFSRLSLCLLLVIAWFGSALPAMGQTTTSDIHVRITIRRGAEGSRSIDYIQVDLTPSLTRIANSAVTVNSTGTPDNRVVGNIHKHSGNFPTAVQNIKIYIQKELPASGRPAGSPIGRFPRDLSGIKPNASAVIDAPDYLALISPAVDSVPVTRSVGDVDVKWKHIGPAAVFIVEVTEDASHRVVFRRGSISENHLLIPASTFEIGKKYKFEVLSCVRDLGKPTGSCAPGSLIQIIKLVQCYVIFKT